MRKTTLTIFLGLVVALISFSVYFLTLAPTITAGDSAEMITAAATLGIPHQSSYPINTTLGHLFTKLPWGNLPWRVNLMSGVLHVLTVLIIFILLIMLLGRDVWFISLGSSLFLAFSRTFWINSLKAEVFPLNDFFTSLMLLAVVYLYKNKNGARYSHFFLSLFALVFGLGFAHHQTIILILPACLYLTWVSYPAIVRLAFVKIKEIFLPSKYSKPKRSSSVKGVNYKDLKTLLVMLVFFGLGLLSYTSLMWLASKDPPLNWGNPNDLGGVLRSFLRVDVGGFGSPAVSDQPSMEKPWHQVIFFSRSVFNDFTLWGVILSTLGIWYLYQKSRKVLFFILLGFLISGPLFLIYANFPLQGEFSQATVLRFNLLPELFLTITLAFGLNLVWDKLTLHIKPSDKLDVWGRKMLELGIGMVFIFPLLSNFKLVDQHQNKILYKYAQTMLTGIEKDALVLLSGDINNFSVDYLRFVEGQGKDKDLAVFSPGQLHMDWKVNELRRRYPDLIIPEPLPGNKFTTTSQVIEANFALRPVYITPDLARLDPVVSSLWELIPKSLMFKLAPISRVSEASSSGEATQEQEQEGGVTGVQDQESVSLPEVERLIIQTESDHIWEVALDLDFEEIKRRSPDFEDPIPFYFTRHFYNLGDFFEHNQLYEDAIRQYQRVLKLDSWFSLAYKRLGTIYGFKLDLKDKQLALDYFSQYLNSGISSQEAQMVYESMQELLKEEAEIPPDSEKKTEESDKIEEEKELPVAEEE